MNPRDTLTDAIGNTPLIALRKASEQTGCTILGKAEFMNPGGSVKDRAAKYIILDAEARGELEPGGVIVEGTAGNTGIGIEFTQGSGELLHQSQAQRVKHLWSVQPYQGNRVVSFDLQIL